MSSRERIGDKSSICISKRQDKRLAILQKSQFLTKRIMERISENMHYETFKYLNSVDLVEIRGMKLGGYQLVSNKLLRSRIYNYFTWLTLDLDDYESWNLDTRARRTSLVLEQTQNKSSIYIYIYIIFSD